MVVACAIVACAIVACAVYAALQVVTGVSPVVYDVCCCCSEKEQRTVWAALPIGLCVHVYNNNAFNKLTPLFCLFTDSLLVTVWDLLAGWDARRAAMTRDVAASKFGRVLHPAACTPSCNPES